MELAFYVQNLYEDLNFYFDYPHNFRKTFENKIVIDALPNSSFTIPLFTIGCLSCITEWNISDINKIVLPFEVPNEFYNPVATRKVDVIFNLFRKSYSRKLLKVKTANTFYYVGKGIIMDTNLHPIIMSTLTIKPIIVDEHPIFTYYKPTLYINPEVFKSKDLVSKKIVKDLIPKCNNLYIIMSQCSSDIRPATNIEDRISMTILNTNDFIEPLAEFKPEYTDQYLQNIVAEHVNDIIKAI